MSCRYGFRVLGPLRSRRRLVDAHSALVGYAACDSRAEVSQEGHLSVFNFDSAFCSFFESQQSTKGYDGLCHAAWVWWDIDRHGDVAQAVTDAVRLVDLLCGRYEIGQHELVLCYSGCKGFHIGVPTSTWNPSPSVIFHRIVRQFAQQLAAQAGVKIDTSVYSKTGLLRAINSRHPKTGCHKRRLSLRQLDELSVEAIHRTAENPEGFELPSVSRTSLQAKVDWRDASQQVESQIEAETQCQAPQAGALNKLTVDFICNGAEEGKRALRLFSAAANLAEFGCSPELAYALLGEAALDSGLTPGEVKYRIDCGLKHGRTEAPRTDEEGHDG